MKLLRKLFVTALLLSISAVLTLPAQAGVSCHNIHARGTGQDNGNGTTTAQIRGGGLLQGTTAATFVPTGAPVDNVLPFDGSITFTTNKATLTVSIIGSFDLSTGAFTATGPVTASTGKLAGASGSLTFNGVENFTNGSFTETIDGQICVDLSP